MIKELPPWLKKRIAPPEKLQPVLRLLSSYHLHTVCESAHCPNLGECFSQGRVTFLILGDTCTRNCKFCMVTKGKPLSLDRGEPERIREAVRQLKLKFVVITSVTRDDLPDGGAEIFTRTIRLLHQDTIKVEVLVPDFQGRKKCVERILSENPEVFAHNLETVPRLYPSIRPEADYHRSLTLLRWGKEISPSQITKTGVMVGLGENEEEVVEVMKDARKAGVDIFTIGQYLPPSSSHYPVKEYISPETFDFYKRRGEELGLMVLSGVWVRSSYLADISWEKRREK